MREPSLRYRGYDGAGDVRRYTDGFVRFVDLSMPLSLPRTDYVLSLEVGEHIPREHEFMYVRNLHAHNCRGIVLSWANIEQMGVAHVNTHSRKYLRTLFASLGYVHSANVSRALRRAARVNWLSVASVRVVIVVCVRAWPGHFPFHDRGCNGAQFVPFSFTPRPSSSSPGAKSVRF